LHVGHISTESNHCLVAKGAQALHVGEAREGSVRCCERKQSGLEWDFGTGERRSGKWVYLGCRWPGRHRH
jgi:hypothetical protein